MHLAYSAISTIEYYTQTELKEIDNEQLIRYRAFQLTCDKYRNEIAAIQKYLPGWMPKFR